MNKEIQENFDDLEGVAIIGMSAQFPGSPDIGSYWRNLCQGSEGISFYDDEQLRARGVPEKNLRSPSFVKASPDLSDIDKFDARFFGYSPSAACLLDPQQRLFLIHSWQALEYAGYTPDNYEGTIGVVGAASLSTYLMFNVMTDPRYTDAASEFQVMLSNDKDYVASRVAYHLGLEGPCMMVQTACSSSMAAVHMACEALISHQSDIMLAGGVSINMPQRSGYFHSEGGISSSDGHCRAFDDSSEGTLFGSGVGVVVLKRLADAISDKDSITAVITGSAISNDGARKVGYTAPSVKGQCDAAIQALQMAGVSSDSIGCMEAHGTGTSLGDMIEVTALSQAFAEESNKGAKEHCALGSVKSNIGHLDAAAGIASLIKMALSVKFGKIPPTLHVKNLNSNIDFENSPFYVNTKLIDWPINDAPRRAGINSTGIGGSNVHAILEQSPVENKPIDFEANDYHFFPFSAVTESALRKTISNFNDWLSRTSDEKLSDAAFTLQAGRKRLPYRSFCVVHSKTAKETKFEDIAKATVFQERSNRKNTFVFPGAGSQYSNMAKDLYDHDMIFRSAMDECSAIMLELTGEDILQKIYSSAEKVDDNGYMAQSQIAMPATFMVEYATAKLLMSRGIQPDVLIGHSFGEYCAACIAGVVTLFDALSIVLFRSRLFDKLPAGKMLAVFGSHETIGELCGEQVSMAAVNSKNYCVVSGATVDVDQFVETLDTQGIECRPLNVNVAAHSPMIDQIIPEFSAFLQTIEFKPPRIPFISNVSGSWITSDDAQDPAYWCRHLRSTVQFKAGVDLLLSDKDLLFLEIGPSNNLSRFIRDGAEKSRRDDVINVIRHVKEGIDDQQYFLEKIGHYWSVGGCINWAAWTANKNVGRIPLPGYPFESASHWIDPVDAPISNQLLSGKQSDVSDWLHAMSWKQEVLYRDKRVLQDSQQVWLILSHGDEFSHAFIEAVKSHGVKVLEVLLTSDATSLDAPESDHEFHINSLGQQSFDDLFKKLADQNRFVDRVISLLALSSDQSFSQLKSFGYDTPIHIARAMQPSYAERSVVFYSVGTHQFSVHVNEKVNPGTALLSSPCIVLPQEFAWLDCQCLDIDTTTVTTNGLSALVDEVSHLAPERIVALRDAHRWVPFYSPFPVQPSDRKNSLSNDPPTFVILGGTGKLGLQLAKYLSSKELVNLVLIRRRSVPNRETWEQMRESEPSWDQLMESVENIESNGSKVLIMSCDIANEGKLEALVNQVESQCGPISGFVHAAGVTGTEAIQLADDIEAEKDEQQFIAKINGLNNLYTVVNKRSPDFVVLISSSVSVFGGGGLLAYTAANLYMDAFAKSVQTDTTWWSVLNMDWLARGDNTGIRTGIDAYAIEPAEANDVYARFFTQRSVQQLFVSTGHFNSRWQHWVANAGRSKGKAKSEKQSSEESTENSQITTEVIGTAVEKDIHKVWSDELGISNINFQDNFFSIGGDSMLAIRIRSKLSKLLGIEIPIAVLYEGLTIKTLAEQIENLSNREDTSVNEIDNSENLRARRKKLIEMQRKRQTT